MLPDPDSDDLKESAIQVFRMIKKVSIGDVVEIPTKLGNAYAQFSHYHADPPKFGALLRVLPGIFRQRPPDLAGLVGQKESFSVFFPLQGAVNRGIVRVVGHEPIPPHARRFPVFRAGNRNPTTGKVEKWWLWDGTKSWKIDELSDAQLDLPIEGVWNDTMLIERIEQGWTPRNAEYFVALARAKRGDQSKQIISEISHFLSVRNRADALVAASRAGELNTESDICEDGVRWLVVVHQKGSLSEERERIREYLVDVVNALGGTYDGWEFRLENTK